MRGSSTVPVVVPLLASFLLLASPIQAQTFSVLHTFSNSTDGATPYGTLALDAAGNLYGTASAGGFTGSNCTSTGCGTVFKLTHRSSGWTFAPLYVFQGNADPSTPYAGVTIGPNGSLYGTTLYGGNSNGGTVFNLRPPTHASANVFGAWSNTVIYNFAGGEDGRYPQYGSLVFDPAGNLYGTTSDGGVQCLGSTYCGTMFELSPSGGGWTKSSSFDFTGVTHGAFPVSGVVLDSAGNLYGTTPFTSFNGVAYELSRTQQGWAETTLYNFAFGVFPYGGVILSGTGTIYGTTLDNVYELSLSGGNWNYSMLYVFQGTYGPWAGLIQDAAGNLYGTTCDDGNHGHGSVFELTPSGSGWTETTLHSFTGGADGSCPKAGVTLDANGNLYGAASAGGMSGGCGGTGCGTVWEITP